MTDRIDIDDLDADSDERTDGDTGSEEQRWLDGSSEDPWGAADSETEGSTAAREREATSDAVDGESDSADGDRETRAMPHVPRANEDSPAGIPVESGGAGAGAAPGDAAGTGPETEEAAASGPAARQSDGAAQSDRGATGGPHGGDADDFTLAFSYEAIRRLAEPRVACADANQWADWIGVVGDVSAPALTGFQREHGLDLDFFNGSGTGPIERLSEIDERSMFYADRMALVGVSEDDERIAQQAGWEFVPLAEAADGADWTIESNTDEEL
ncbi:MAG: hypothetical protein ABEK02_08265 [Haloquadratum sp.]